MPSLLFPLLCAAHFLDHFVLLIFPTAAFGLARDWGLSYAEALALGWPAFTAFAVATLPAGWLGDRWGPKPMMLLFFFGTAFSAVLTGLAQNEWQLGFALALLGASAAIYHPVATALLVRDSGRAGRSLALNGLFGNMGVAAAAIATAAATESLGWRWSYLLTAIPCLAGGLLFLGLRIEADRSQAPRQAASGDGSAPDRRWNAALRRILAVLLVSAICGGLIFNGVTIALPKLFSETLTELAPSLEAVGAYAALTFAIAGFAQLPVGQLLDRIGAKPLLIAVTCCQAILLFAIWQSQGSWTLPLAILLLLLIFGEIPITGWLLAHHVAPAWRSRAYSVQHLFSLGVGAAALPLVAGLQASSGSSSGLFGLLGFAAAAIFAVAWLLPRERPAPRSA